MTDEVRISQVAAEVYTDGRDQATAKVTQVAGVAFASLSPEARASLSQLAAFVFANMKGDPTAVCNLSQLMGVVWVAPPVETEPEVSVVTVYQCDEPLFRYPDGVGYKLYVYRRGTVTPIPSYANVSLGLNDWPVELDDDGTGDGVALLYLDEDATLILKDTDGDTVEGYPVDWIKPTLPSELSALDVRVTAVEGSVGNLQTSVSGITDTASALNDRVTAAEGDIDSLQSTVSSHTSTLGTHTSNISNLQSADTSLSGSISTLNNTVAGHTSDIGTLQSTVSSHTSTIGTHTTNISDLQAADTALDGRVDALEAADVLLDGRIDALEGTAITPPSSAAGKFLEPTTNLLLQWGTATTASNGYATVTFGTAYASAPVVMVTGEWAGSEFTIAKLNSRTTAGFGAQCATTDGDGTHAQQILFNWVAIGFKAT